jgi:hypothetical protein
MIRRFYVMSPSDPTTVERVMFEMVEESGVKLMLNTLGVDSLTEDNRITGIKVENKSGRQAVLAKVVVDVSGEGDIAALAGAPFEVGRNREHTIETYKYKKDGLTEPMTIMMRMGDVDLLKYVDYQKKAKMSKLPDKIETLSDTKYTVYGNINYSDFTKDPKELAKFPKARCGIKTGRGLNEVFVNTTRVTGVLAFDADGVTQAEIQARKNVFDVENFLKKHVPGFENAYIIDTAITMQPREARRFIGEYMLTEYDIRSGADFPDTVAKLFAPLDIHQPDGTGGYTAQFPEYDLPYRCLVTKQVDGLLVAGRQISADHYAHGSTRAEAVCMYSGQAAGAAAALSARLGTTPRKLDVKSLQSTLQEWGTILFESVFEKIRAMYPEMHLKEEYAIKPLEKKKR